MGFTCLLNSILKSFINFGKSMDIIFPNIAFILFSLSFQSRTPTAYILDTLCYLSVFYVLLRVFHYFLFLCFNLDIFYCFHLPSHQSSPQFIWPINQLISHKVMESVIPLSSTS